MSPHATPEEIINNKEILNIGATSCNDSIRIREILSKGRELKGLDLNDVAVLAGVSDSDLLDELFEAAKYVKDEIYGRRLVIFAPLYISNLCANECTYCAFRAGNNGLIRRALSQEEMIEETKILVSQGHKRLLLVAGEAYPRQGFEYILDSIKTIYDCKDEKGASIRRINVNIAPLETDEFRLLKETGIGTYQLFQETYDRKVYGQVHLRGRKSDYDWRVTAIDRAMEAGIDDCGIGVLFGLADWKYELLALMQHTKHLEKKFGVGPHTISVPRIEWAAGSDLSERPPQPVSDEEFKKIIAILRIAVPYTGLIMSTRESPELRSETFELGVSQISAGSRTNPGGYTDDHAESSQFSLGDHRSLDEVVRDVSSKGYIPSFCTGCYRLGRTGQDFMDLAKPGLIKKHCAPNAASSFMEFLKDYASPETQKVGEAAVAKFLTDMDGKLLNKTQSMLDNVISGQRDVYC